MPLLEICTFNATDVYRAVSAGADRIELCASYVEGGITPSAAAIQHAFSIIPAEQVVVMIRPRGGNFYYDTFELEVMQQDILRAKEFGAKNVIFGILDTSGRLDLRRNKELIDLAAPMHCTLQRAFDLTPDPMEALGDAIQCGFKRILTSGQAATAWDGRNLLRSLIRTAENKISILPGAGINSSNVAALIAETGCNEVHTSAKKKFTEPAVSFKVRAGIYDNSHMTETDPDEVKAIKNILLQLA